MRTAPSSESSANCPNRRGSGLEEEDSSPPPPLLQREKRCLLEALALAPPGAASALSVPHPPAPARSEQFQWTPVAVPWAGGSVLCEGSPHLLPAPRPRRIWSRCAGPLPGPVAQPYAVPVGPHGDPVQEAGGAPALGHVRPPSSRLW